MNIEDLALKFEHLLQDYTGNKLLRADLFRHWPDIDTSKNEDLKKAKRLGEILGYLDIALYNLGEKNSNNSLVINECKNMLEKNPNYQSIQCVIEKLAEKNII